MEEKEIISAAERLEEAVKKIEISGISDKSIAHMATAVKLINSTAHNGKIIKWNAIIGTFIVGGLVAVSITYALLNYLIIERLNTLESNRAILQRFAELGIELSFEERTSYGNNQEQLILRINREFTKRDNSIIINNQ